MPQREECPGKEATIDGVIYTWADCSAERKVGRPCAMCSSTATKEEAATFKARTAKEAKAKADELQKVKEKSRADGKARKTREAKEGAGAMRKATKKAGDPHKHTKN